MRTPGPTGHLFPRFHPRPATGFLNDPNGPLFVNGRWHLWYQYRPATAQNSPVSWGHLSSPDLVRWDHHRPAMGPQPGGPDRDGCWSGNTVLLDGEVTAFYSGHRLDNPYQSVLSATSHDGGSSFGPGRQVLADPEPAEKVLTFRDPFVWSEPDGYRMVVGSGDTDSRAAARFYRSTDGRTWTYLGHLTEMVQTQAPDWDTGGMWECPQLLSFGDRDVLLVGTWTAARGVMEVLTLSGVRVEDRMQDPVVARFDGGPNFYAASALRDSPLGPLVWGWSTEGRTAAWAVEEDWSGLITIPRLVALTADGRLASRPVPALVDLRGDELPARSSEVAGQRPGSLEVAGLPAQVEVEVVLAAARPAPSTTLRLVCSPTEHLDVEVDWVDGTVAVDRSAASDDDRAHGGRYAFADDLDGGTTLRWLVDGSISELFTASGRTSTVRFYPLAAPPWTLHVSGLGGDDVVRVWPLDGGRGAAADVTAGTG